MCYRCSVCNNVSKPGEARRVFQITRERPKLIHVPRDLHHPRETTTTTREEIAQEIPVCFECYMLLEHGMAIEALKRRHSPVLTPSAPAAKRIDI